MDNIQKEVMKRFGGIIPKNIQVLTFDTFVYNHLIKPFEPLYLERKSRGVDVKTILIEDSRDKRYISMSEIKHYINNNDEFYINRMSKFFLNRDKKTQKLIISRLERYCDSIYIDEFQDYNGYDFKVIKFLLEKTNIKVIAVGDINQSCLVPLRGIGNRVAKEPFHNIKTVDDLKKKLSSKISYDEQSLRKSRRVPKLTCEFIRSNLEIKMESSSEVSNTIIYLEDINDINNIIQNNDIPKLVWNKSIKNPLGYKYTNWTYSKGDTYLKSCIIITSKTDDIDNWKNLSSGKVKNALYVALTRSKGDLYIIKSKDYLKWCRYIEKDFSE